MIEQFQNGLLSHSYYICCYDGGETVRSLMDGKVEEMKINFLLLRATLLLCIRQVFSIWTILPVIY